MKPVKFKGVDCYKPEELDSISDKLIILVDPEGNWYSPFASEFSYHLAPVGGFTSNSDDDLKGDYSYISTLVEDFLQNSPDHKCYVFDSIKEMIEYFYMSFVLSSTNILDSKDLK